MFSKVLHWRQIDEVWDIDHECEGMTAQEAYNAWQEEIKAHPDCGMSPIQWDIEDFKMYINWLENRKK